MTWFRWRSVLLLVLALVGVGVVSLALQLELPSPTGPYAVGRTQLSWQDPARAEFLTDDPDDPRTVVAQVWYPATPQTGRRTPYFPNLSEVARGLRGSGEVTALEVAGLPFIRSQARREAEILETAAPYPLLFLSPGNGTNVEFYAALAGELASHGYIVVGLSHPYDVAAVALPDGRVAQFVAGPQALAERGAFVAARIEERMDDVLFALEQLSASNADAASPFFERLDLSRLGILGHSLGGITAAQVCQHDLRFKVCLNFDGLLAGGAFAVQPNPALPSQPFLFMTKEEWLHPVLEAQFEALPSESYKVVLHGANHVSFTDGPLLLPSLLPLPNEADRIHTLIRAYTLAFLDKTLKDLSAPLLSASEGEDVTVEVYTP